MVQFSGDGGQASVAKISTTQGIAFDTAGNYYIADTYNNVIRKVTIGTGVISMVAGNGNQGFSGDGGAATSPSLNRPLGVAVDSAGNLYIADTFNNVVREVTVSNGNISTIAGMAGQPGGSGDGGPATSALLSDVYGVAVDASSNVYIADIYKRRPGLKNSI